MKTVLIYSFISGFALLLGALISIYLPISKKTLARIMAVGSGILISSLSIDLMSDAFELTKDAYLLASAFLMGALVFVLGDRYIDKLGGENRGKIDDNHSYENTSNNKSSNGLGILLGTILDGIPETLVLGMTMAINPESGGFVFLIAIFMSNLPEGIASTSALVKAGYPKPKILSLWGTMLLLTMLLAVIGYQFLGQASNEIRCKLMCFASGAILAMLCDSMLPESFRKGGNWTGFYVAIGFILAFLLSKFF